jgi:hypothetical protein
MSQFESSFLGFTDVDGKGHRRVAIPPRIPCSIPSHPIKQKPEETSMIASLARFADSNRDRRQLALAAAAGLASAFALARTLPLAIDAASAIGDTLCSVSSALSSPLDKVD